MPVIDKESRKTWQGSQEFLECLAAQATRFLCFKQVFLNFSPSRIFLGWYWSVMGYKIKLAQLWFGWSKLPVCSANNASRGKSVRYQYSSVWSRKKVCPTLGGVDGENTVLWMVNEVLKPARGSSTEPPFRSDVVLARSGSLKVRSCGTNFLLCGMSAGRLGVFFPAAVPPAVWKWDNPSPWGM